MVSTNQMAKVARAQRDDRLRKKRSRSMSNLIDALDKQERNLSWLARKLKRSRQAVSAWEHVPDELVPDIARIVGIEERLLKVK